MYVFLFTDIEGSTRLWEEHTSVMAAVIARHDEILRQVIAGYGGRITKHTGDGITAAFDGGFPLACALEAQLRFAAELWGEIDALPIRAGLHAGDAEFHLSPGTADGDYFGPPVNATARVMSAAWGGQILLTPEVTQTSPLPDGATLLDLGLHLLKNVTAPQQLYQLDHPQLPRHQFPPLRTLSGRSIRQAVGEQGGQLVGLEPQAMGIALVATTLQPTLLGELDPESGAFEGNLGVLEDLGAVSLRGFVADFARRLRSGPPLPATELQALLQAELQTQWQVGGESAIALRADASRLLQAVHGVEAALAAASGEVKEALARGLAGLGQQFGEFRWMLAGVQDTLAEMQALQQRQLAMTEEILQLQREQVRSPLPALLPEAQDPPAFLKEGARDVSEAPVFVARERELARLDGFLQKAMQGQGRVVFVAGDPGQGKTALVNEFARRAMGAHSELLAAAGNCNAYSGVGDPYLPFREAMAMLTGDVEDRWLAGSVSRSQAQRLWEALPEVSQALLDHGPNVLGVLVLGSPLLSRARVFASADADPPWLEALRTAIQRGQARSDGLEQSHLFEQVTNVLHALAAKHPLLLILDDLQWADTASLGLLFHLGRRLAAKRILIVGTYRPEEVALDRGQERHPLEKAVRELRRQFGDIQVDLTEAEAAEGQGFVDALLATEPNRLDDDFRQALFQHTGGHPLFTVELLRDMQERGDLVRDEDGCWVEGTTLEWAGLPARVEAVIEERVGRLEGELREILNVASVEGEDFTAQVVARVQQIGELQLLRKLSEELEKRHRLVREREGTSLGSRRLSRYRFAHVLFQQYLYNDLSDGLRTLLHREIGSVLEQVYAGREEEIAVQLAHHFAGDSEKEGRYARLAGEQAAARYANDEAIHYLSRALELTEDAGERFELLSARAAVYALTAQRKAQLEDTEAMLELADGLETDRLRFEARIALADYHLATVPTEAREPAEEARTLARKQGDPVGEAHALRRLGAEAQKRYSMPESRDHLRAAADRFREAGQQRETAACLRPLSAALAYMDERSAALQAAQEALDLSRAVGDRRQEAKSLRSLAWVLTQQSRHGEARAAIEQALALHRELGERGAECEALNVLGIILSHLGEPERAESCYREALQLAEAIGKMATQGSIVHNMVLSIFRPPGEYEAGLRFLAEHLEKARAAGASFMAAQCQYNQAALLAELGQYEAAVEAARAVISFADRFMGEQDQAELRAYLGRFQTFLGHHEQARENLAEALHRLENATEPFPDQYVLAYWASAALQLGTRTELHQGLAFADRAVSAWRGVGHAYDDLGDALCTKAMLHLALLEAGEGAHQAAEALATSSELLVMAEAYATVNQFERYYYAHWLALRANGQDADADDYLQRTYERVMLVAGKTTDPELRRSWLENVEVNRHIVEEWAARGG